MTVLEEEVLAAVLASGEEVLSRRTGSPVSLSEPEDLGGTGRSTVMRARVGDNAFSDDRSVVVKAFDEAEPEQLQREVASYRYVTALPSQSRPGPQLLAADIEARIVVLTDLGHGRSMVELLGEDADAAARGVSAWGQALGRMHAATAYGEDDFDALLRHSVRQGKGARTAGGGEVATQAAAAAAAVDEIGRRLDITVPDRIVAELGTGTGLFEAGDYRAFSPSDVGPENIFINDDGLQFMDYEFGAFRDATLDVAYALVTFPARLAETAVGKRAALETALVDAWRSEAQPVWPALRRDGELQRHILTARTLWVWLCTHWLLSGAAGAHDWALHTADARVVLTRWGDLVDAAARAGDGELAQSAADVETALRRFWFE